MPRWKNEIRAPGRQPPGTRTAWLGGWNQISSAIESSAVAPQPKAEISIWQTVPSISAARGVRKSARSSNGAGEGASTRFSSGSLTAVPQSRPQPSQERPAGCSSQGVSPSFPSPSRSQQGSAGSAGGAGSPAQQGVRPAMQTAGAPNVVHVAISSRTKRLIVRFIGRSGPSARVYSHPMITRCLLYTRSARSARMGAERPRSARMRCCLTVGRKGVAP